MTSFPYCWRSPELYKKVMEDYAYFMITGFSGPFGYIHKSVYENLDWPSYWDINREDRTVTLTKASSFDERTDALRETLLYNHEHRTVPHLQKWSDDIFGLHTTEGDHIANMNILGSAVLGATSANVQLIAWTATDNGRMYWLQRRSMNRIIHPGKLDNTAGGGLGPGESPFEAMVREAHEEASIPESYAREHLVSCGTVTYHLITNADGSPGSQAHVQHTFEMELPPDIIPTPYDNEVEDYITMTEQEVLVALFGVEFKLIVGSLWLDHFIRHGIITPENEENFSEIRSRIHRDITLFRLEDD
jgi:8-oxo-dGTP pyrophosphatase MutT (NUDIX family)